MPSLNFCNNVEVAQRAYIQYVIRSYYFLASGVSLKSFKILSRWRLQSCKVLQFHFVCANYPWGFFRSPR